MGLEPSQNTAWDLNPCGWDLNSENPFWDSVLSCPVMPGSFQLAGQALLSMGILQTRILEWVGMPSSRGFSQPRDGTKVSCIAGEGLLHCRRILYCLNHQGSTLGL